MWYTADMEDTFSLVCALIATVVAATLAVIDAVAGDWGWFIWDIALFALCGWVSLQYHKGRV